MGYIVHFSGVTLLGDCAETILKGARNGTKYNIASIEM